MITGIDKTEVIEFVSEQDKGEVKTVFELGVLSYREKMSLFAQFDLKDDDVSTEDMLNKSYDIVKKGLRKIKNIKMGDDLKTIDVIDDSAMDCLPIDVVTELANKIMVINMLSETERKN